MGHMDEKQRILQEIRRVANEVAPEVLTQRAFSKAATFSVSKLRYHFGSFSQAMAAAGIVPNAPGFGTAPQSRLDDDDLLAEIGKVWAHLGQRPTEAAFNAASQYSVRPYYRRWGTFNRAVDEYLARFGVPDTQRRQETRAQLQHQPTANSPPPPAVVVPRTHKPKASTRRERVLYGEPIDFRGLRYAPINEQGVVYLFGMVSRELGFLIESVRTDFPDCEGKRSTNKTGTQWEHVRIEFEYRSRNFLDHGHDPDECDLIVCWVHDWEDCPLEVLELRSTLPLLPKTL